MNEYSWNLDQSLSIAHFGILGMHWGKKNGPPYPLGSSDYSASEKSAAKSAGVSVGSNSGKGSIAKVKSSKKGLSATQKKVLIGAGITVASIALAYGGYKLAQHYGADKIIKNKINEIVKSNESISALAGNSDFSTIKETATSKASNNPPTATAEKMAKAGFKTLSHAESIDERVKNVNPYLRPDGTRDPAGKNNCTLCSVFAYLRGQGVDVKAGSTGGKAQNLNGIVQDVFPNAAEYSRKTKSGVLDGRATTFGKSVKDAEVMLVDRYGDNAEGVCSITWSSGGGHAFSWKLVNGKAQFFDAQAGRVDISSYWNSSSPLHIDTNGSLQIARLDDLIPDGDGIAKWQYKG